MLNNVGIRKRLLFFTILMLLMMNSILIFMFRAFTRIEQLATITAPHTSSSEIVTEEIAAGNLLIDAQPRSEHDGLILNLNRMINEMNAILAELDGLIFLVRNGQLDARGNADAFSGVWHDLIVEINHVIDAFMEMTMVNEQLKAENLRMGMELDIARRIQMMVLPKHDELEHVRDLEIVGYMKPADEVGGDYYDVLRNNGTLHLGIGDVTGHGLESGVVMLMAQTAIRTLIEHGETDPYAFVKTLNRTMYKNIQRMGVEKNLTFALLKYQEGILKIIGQHEEVIVIRKDGKVERVDTIELGFPIGLEEHIHEWFKEVSIPLDPGDGIVLYTDGITEAENPDGQQYGLKRLCNIASHAWSRKSVEQIKQTVIDDVTRFIGTQTIYDDLTLVILKHIGN